MQNENIDPELPEAATPNDSPILESTTDPDPDPIRQSDLPPSESPRPSEPPETPDLPTLLAEAERRGYMRALNEKLSEQLSRPELYADLARLKTSSPGAAPSAICSDLPAEDAPLTSRFLADIRPGVWD